MNTREPNRYPSDILPKSANSGLDQRQTETFFHYFFYDSPLASYACDNEGYITFYNSAAVELWGREPQIGVDLYCGSWKIFYAEGGAMQVDQCPMAVTLKQGASNDKKIIVIQRPDHSFRTVMVYARPVFDREGLQIGAHNTMVDISEKENIDKKQAILAAIVGSSDNAIISKNLNGIITSWNPGAEKIFGYTEHEIVGKSILQLVPADRVEEEKHILSTLTAGIRVDHLQTIRVSKSGLRIPISLTVSPVKDEYGNVIGASKIARDITEEVRAQQAIKRNTENLEILNAIGRVIVEKLDVKVILQQVTDATTKITGADFGAFFYNSVNENGEEFELFIVSGAAKEAFNQLEIPRNTAVYEATFANKKVVRSHDITKDSRYSEDYLHHGVLGNDLAVVSYLAVPVISKSGKVIGSLLFGHHEAGVFTSEHEDIVGSIASQAAVALENSKLFEEVKALSAKKDEFIALASHELKTPITSIKGYLQISARAQKDKVGQLFVDKALVQVERLNALVTDLLDSSKIVAGKLQFNLEDFDLCQLLREVIETFNYSTTSHRINFDDPGCTYVIKGDKQRIEQVLSNLLNNAIKYSPNAQEVFVTTDVNDGVITVRIRDEGIGLSSTQKGKIFSRFYRADTPANISGLGLGLYLTKEIIDRHEGTIDVDSELKKGSTFYFSLPLTA